VDSGTESHLESTLFESPLVRNISERGVYKISACHRHRSTTSGWYERHELNNHQLLFHVNVPVTAGKLWLTEGTNKRNVNTKRLQKFSQFFTAVL